MCHIFLLNVEFGNACRFPVFKCLFSIVSRFPFPRFQSPSVDTDEQSTGSCPHFYQTFKMLRQILRVDNVFVRFYFMSSYYSTCCLNLSLYHPLY